MGFFTGVQHLSDWGLLTLRLGVGAPFLVHGIQKSAMWKMQPSAQLPAGMLSILRFLAIVEPLGAVGVLVGFLTQPAAAGLAIIMLGAIRLKAVQMHRRFTGDGGWELDFILLAAAIALFISGAGKLSLDRVLLRM
jgi:putative oxidoreductase